MKASVVEVVIHADQFAITGVTIPCTLYHLNAASTVRTRTGEGHGGRTSVMLALLKFPPLFAGPDSVLLL